MVFRILIGLRTNAQTADLDTVLPEETVGLVREAAQISMGTEVHPYHITFIALN